MEIHACLHSYKIKHNKHLMQTHLKINQMILLISYIGFYLGHIFHMLLEVLCKAQIQLDHAIASAING